MQVHVLALRISPFYEPASWLWFQVTIFRFRECPRTTARPPKLIWNAIKPFGSNNRRNESERLRNRRSQTVKHRQWWAIYWPWRGPLQDQDGPPKFQRSNLLKE